MSYIWIAAPFRTHEISKRDCGLRNAEHLLTRHSDSWSMEHHHVWSIVPALSFDLLLPRGTSVSVTFEIYWSTSADENNVEIVGAPATMSREDSGCSLNVAWMTEVADQTKHWQIQILRTKKLQKPRSQNRMTWINWKTYHRTTDSLIPCARVMRVNEETLPSSITIFLRWRAVITRQVREASWELFVWM